MPQGKVVEVPCPVCDQPRRCEVFAPDPQAINPMEGVNCDDPRHRGCRLSDEQRAQLSMAALRAGGLRP